MLNLQLMQQQTRNEIRCLARLASTCRVAFGLRSGCGDKGPDTKTHEERHFRCSWRRTRPYHGRSLGRKVLTTENHCKPTNPDVLQNCYNQRDHRGYRLHLHKHHISPSPLLSAAVCYQQRHHHHRLRNNPHPTLSSSSSPSSIQQSSQLQHKSGYPPIVETSHVPVGEPAWT